ncbi:ceramidase domain-containing protein [Amorphus orientalis]|uniref:Ceramidase n=1 Tax=Amorphus orientalis TaxID=649198 RepID=A0AAE3VSA3_9HYPH|nr:ceramidase domain-containing protein [Amorphus orientalis]MDQ0317258.1 hypothetical protein [Amorphus orientalis]
MDGKLDLYCERTGPEFWSEPLNAITNAAFLVAAVMAFLAWRQRPADWPVFLLIGLTALIGIGSFLFHTFAERWAAIADTAPIGVFILGYFALAMRRFFSLSVIWTLVLLAAFVAFSVLSVPLFERAVGGSAGYMPALVTLVFVGTLLASLGKRRALGLLAAGGVFAASLAFRILDEPVCAHLPIGTHFLWHVLNATVLYILTRTAMRSKSVGRAERMR